MDDDAKEVFLDNTISKLLQKAEELDQLLRHTSTIREYKIVSSAV
ncbi:MAG TPA: hypothetical protein VH796_10210 [Nitrososphaeraceae archaeon]